MGSVSWVDDEPTHWKKKTLVEGEGKRRAVSNMLNLRVSRY